MCRRLATSASHSFHQQLVYGLSTAYPQGTCHLIVATQVTGCQRVEARMDNGSVWDCSRCTCSCSYACRACCHPASDACVSWAVLRHTCPLSSPTTPPHAYPNAPC